MTGISEPERLRVFVNGKALSVDRGSNVLAAMRAFDSAEADEIAAGRRAVTDSRGLPVSLDAELTGGAVFRIVSSRALRGDEKESTGAAE